VLIVEEAHPPVVDEDFVFAVDDRRLNDVNQIDLASGFGRLIPGHFDVGMKSKVIVGS
jgi:hypothetical protein